CTLFSRLDSSFLLCDILKPVGFHIEEIHGLCCAFFYSAFFCTKNPLPRMIADMGAGARFHILSQRKK
ncbi:hypothetical protein, partial [Ruminococcus sp.]|uniref:hypothetical protein n=1 Tax=Ruminococcus sp. TaxID=41978 RepID=UPI003A980097